MADETVELLPAADGGRAVVGLLLWHRAIDRSLAATDPGGSA